MRDAVILGSVVSTVKHKALDGKKLLIVQVLDNEGKPEGRPQVCIDLTGAGKGDRVILNWDGIGTGEYCGDPHVPQRAWICGIVDDE